MTERVFCKSPNPAFSNENTLSVAAEEGCIAKTFLTPFNQEGKADEFSFITQVH